VKYLPTSPLELANPCGNRLDVLSNSSLGVSMAFPATTIARAVISCSPLAAVEIDDASCPAIGPNRDLTGHAARSHFDPSRGEALGTYVTSILDLAEIEQPRLHVLAPMHAGDHARAAWELQVAHAPVEPQRSAPSALFCWRS